MGDKAPSDSSRRAEEPFSSADFSFAPRRPVPENRGLEGASARACAPARAASSRPRLSSTCPVPSRRPTRTPTHAVPFLVSFAPGGHGPAGGRVGLASSSGEAYERVVRHCAGPHFLPLFELPPGPALSTSGIPAQLLLPEAQDKAESNLTPTTNSNTLHLQSLGSVRTVSS